MSSQRSSTVRTSTQLNEATPKKTIQRNKSKATNGKRGRPSKVIRSGKRKLARLYICTTLSAGQICDVMYNFSKVKIAERTVQNHIQEVMHTDLKSARPKDARDGRERVLRMLRYKHGAPTKSTTGCLDSVDEWTPLLPLTETSRKTQTSLQWSLGPAMDSPLERIADRSRHGVDARVLYDGDHPDRASQNATANSRSDESPCETPDAMSCFNLESPGSPESYKSVPKDGVVWVSPRANVEEVDWDRMGSTNENVVCGVEQNAFGFDFSPFEVAQQPTQSIEAECPPLPYSSKNSTTFENDGGSTSIRPYRIAIPANMPEPAPLHNTHEISPANLPSACVSNLDHDFVTDWGNSWDFPGNVEHDSRTIDMSLVSDSSCSDRPMNPQVSIGNQYSSTATTKSLGVNSSCQLQSSVTSMSSVSQKALDLSQHTVSSVSHKVAALSRYATVPAKLTNMNISRLFPESGPASSSKRSKRPLSVSSSVTSRKSRSRLKYFFCSSTRSLDAGTPGPRALSSSSDRRHSLSRSIHSHSSSFRGNLIDIFNRLSPSSGATKTSSTESLVLEPVDEMALPKAETVDKLYTQKPPVAVPGLFIPSSNDTPGPYNWLKTLIQSACTCISCLTSEVSAFNATLGGVATEPWNHAVLSSVQSVGPDRFNNSSLHIAAALGAGYVVLRALIGKGATINAINTAGQTFMHVLNPATLASTGYLPYFLRILDESSFDFSKQDTQGTSILQSLLQYPLHHDIISEILEVLQPHLPSMASRDNLGRCIQSQLLRQAQYVFREWTHLCEQGIYSLLLQYYGMKPDLHNAWAFDGVPPATSERSQCALQASIRRAVNEPGYEDSHGRNGLHCAAQLVVEQPKQRASKHLDKLSVDVNHWDISELLATGVKVNDYDKTGKTPLLALLSYIKYSEKENHVIIKQRVTDLIEGGASVHSRDREGETPLHVAVKRGIITATQILIDSGANLHAKQKDGKGVVQMALEMADEVRSHKEIHKTLDIRIMHCINLVKEAGAEDFPSHFQEWDVVK